MFIYTSHGFKSTVVVQAERIKEHAQDVIDVIKVARQRKIEDKIDELVALTRTTNGFFGFRKKELPPYTREEALQILKDYDDNLFRSVYDELLMWNEELETFVRRVKFLDDVPITMSMELYSLFCDWALFAQKKKEKDALERAASRDVADADSLDQ